MALSCLRGSESVFIGCHAFGTTKPASLGVLAAHLQCQRPFPHPRLWLCLQEEPPQTPDPLVPSAHL